MAAHVVGIYRRRNARRLSRLVGEPDPNWRYAFWAFDEPAPGLGAWTVGSGAAGRSGKFDLLNRILKLAPVEPGSFLVVVDDDITLRRGSLRRLCSVMERAELGLAQPAHARRSRSSYEFNRAVLGSRARLTTFVEIGPVFAAAPGWVHRIAPFPDRMGMGWGLELVWARLQQEGCRLGVVDCVTVQHDEPPTRGYAHEEEERRAQALMREAGISYMREAQRVLGTWPVWRERPAWLEE